MVMVIKEFDDGCEFLNELGDGDGDGDGGL